MTRRQQKSHEWKYVKPVVPLKQGRYRDPAHVKAVVLRLGVPYLNQLDHLCHINDRSRREVVEMLIDEAAFTLSEHPDDRIMPL